MELDQMTLVVTNLPLLFIMSARNANITNETLQNTFFNRYTGQIFRFFDWSIFSLEMSHGMFFFSQYFFIFEIKHSKSALFSAVCSFCCFVCSNESSMSDSMNGLDL